MQMPPMMSKPGPHGLFWHTPATHGDPAAQMLPHAPQFCPLVCVSTQMPPHAVCVGGHVAHGALQTPFTQPVPAGHTWPHAPQLLTSMLVYVHVPPQFVEPLLQPHVPLGSQYPVQQSTWLLQGRSSRLHWPLPLAPTPKRAASSPATTTGAAVGESHPVAATPNTEAATPAPSFRSVSRRLMLRSASALAKSSNRLMGASDAARGTCMRVADRRTGLTTAVRQPMLRFSWSPGKKHFQSTFRAISAESAWYDFDVHGRARQVASGQQLLR